MPHVTTRPTSQARTARQILDEIREPILAGLSKAVRRAFAATIDELLEKLLAEKSWDLRQAIDESLDLLRNGREGIEARFDQACVEEWVSRTGAGRDVSAYGSKEGGGERPNGAAKAEQKAIPATLSLMDDNAIGDQLTVGRIATRARRRLEEEQIDGLRARFGALLERDWFSDNDFPIAPDVILEALRKALAAFGPVKVVADLLDLFEPKISADLAVLYAEINALLIKRGVMPEIKYQISKAHSGAAGREDDVVEADDEEADADQGGFDDSHAGNGSSARTDVGRRQAGASHNQGQHGTQGGGAGAGQVRGRHGSQGHGGQGNGGQGNGGQGNGGQGNGSQGYRGQGGGYQAGTGYEDGGSVGGGRGRSFMGHADDADGTPGAGSIGVHGDPDQVGGGDLNEYAQGGEGDFTARAMAAPSMLSGNVVSSLAEQVGRRLPAAQGSATRYLSDSSRFGTRHANLPAASDNLLTALTSIQVVTPVEGQDAADMVATARATSAQAAREHGSPLERLIIETVGLVFEHVYEDPSIADTIKQQLLRLQVAAFKAALIDPSFFARPEHPMRRLIDRIVEIGSDPDFETDPGSPLVNEVADVVSWVLTSFDRDLDIFETAISRVLTIAEAETGRRSERLAKVAVAAAKAETLERTRDDVRNELLVGVDPAAPEFVTRFIVDHWAEVVSRIRTGADYAPFDDARARRTARTLLWSIAPKLPSQVRELASELPQLIADLSRGLSFVATSEAERELFFSELLAWHGAAIAEAKRMQQNNVVRSTRVTAAIEVARRAPSRPKDDEAAIADAEPDPATTPNALAGADAKAVTDADDDARPSRPVTGGEDAVAVLDLVNGTEIELHSATGESKRLKLGWMSPARTVFIFSRYPKDHWTAKRAVLNQLLEQGRVRVISRPLKTGSVIESLKAR